jgi:hypothetical protein
VLSGDQVTLAERWRWKLGENAEVVKGLIKVRDIELGFRLTSAAESEQRAKQDS